VSPEGSAGTADVGGGIGAEADEKPEASSFRLLLTLGMAGAIAGGLLVFVFLWSQPKILAYRAMVLREAVTEVLKGPDHFESIFLLDGELVTRVPEGVDTLDLDRVFLGYDEVGEPIGFALEAEGFGFQDIIGVIFGYDAENRQVIGMKVLRHLETPGLGDKIVKDSAWVAEFDGVDTPILGVKPDRNTGDPSQADMITGATISSKAVIKIINERIAELGNLLGAYEPTGGVPAESPEGAEPPGNEAGIPTLPVGTGGGQEERQ
jgi:electron transport complex protein RnfG